MNFGKLDDSPMFRKQVQASEESAEALRERCQKFYKGCRKYTEGLGEAYDGDIAFASSLETFGGGHDDPISIAVGGPVMTKFTIALREIGTYKEVLRSQVEHMLNDRLANFVNSDLQDVKEVRKRFDKATLHYDQVREKFMSLKKSTRIDIVTETEEDLRNARSAFEQARFNLVTALSNIEAKKKFEFLEAVSGTMDAHLRYFKQGYELLHQMEPYIHQAENAVDRMDWIDKITAVIASLLNSQLPEQVGYSQRVPRSPRVSGHQGKISDTNSWSSSSDLEQLTANEYASMRSYVTSCQDTIRGMQGHVAVEQQERPLDTLRKVPGNDVCADCGCHDPDWASLNLGILLCIECSGVHRNLGVHISKVRSLTLDVRVWELSVISLFQSLGNMYANSIWEELLESGKHNDDAHNRSKVLDLDSMH